MPERPTNSYIVGVDGGATGTTAVVSDAQGHIRGWGEAGPANYRIAGREGAAASLRAAVHAALKAAAVRLAAVDSLALGLAGLDHPSDQAIYREIVESLKWDLPFVAVNDAVVAWAGATYCQPGVIVIAGTGCNAFGVNEQGQEWKASGWDYLLADEGSGYWIGLQGMRAAMRAYDGRGEPTALLAAMSARYDLEDPREMVQVVYDAGFGKTEVAAFARTVAQCAAEGDAAARRIMLAAADEVALAVEAVVHRLGIERQRFIVGLIGGVFQSALFRGRFSRAVLQVAPQAQIEFARLPPAAGAVLYAFHRAGRLTEAVVAAVEKSAANVLEAARWKRQG
ncbi:MAG: ATPase [Anaerolineae bacterium]|nr:ATPase [Anaerolineae bacterium]